MSEIASSAARQRRVSPRRVRRSVPRHPRRARSTIARAARRGAPRGAAIGCRQEASTRNELGRQEGDAGEEADARAEPGVGSLGEPEQQAERIGGFQANGRYAPRRPRDVAVVGSVPRRGRWQRPACVGRERHGETRVSEWIFGDWPVDRLDGHGTCRERVVQATRLRRGMPVTAGAGPSPSSATSSAQRWMSRAESSTACTTAMAHMVPGPRRSVRCRPARVVGARPQRARGTPWTSNQSPALPYRARHRASRTPLRAGD